jgi:hypothetical protein
MVWFESMARARAGPITQESREAGVVGSVANGNGPRRPEHDRNTHVNVALSVSLLPVLMPLLARVRHLLDLDAEPSAIDAYLIDSGLESLVPVRRGLRIPGTIYGFEAALGVLLSGRPRMTSCVSSVHPIRKRRCTSWSTCAGSPIVWHP